VLATWQSITAEQHESRRSALKFSFLCHWTKELYAFEGARRYELWAKKVLTALKIGLEAVPHI